MVRWAAAAFCMTRGAILDKFIGDSVLVVVWRWGLKFEHVRCAPPVPSWLSHHPSGMPPSLAGRPCIARRVALCRMPDATYTLLGSDVNTTFRMESLTRLPGDSRC